MIHTENDIMFPEPREGGYTCKKCGEKGLVWGLKNDEWHLYDRNHKSHTCETKEHK